MIPMRLCLKHAHKNNAKAHTLKIFLKNPAYLDIATHMMTRSGPGAELVSFFGVEEFNKHRPKYSIKARP